jgi:hypothetical protein
MNRRRTVAAVVVVASLALAPAADAAGRAHAGPGGGGAHGVAHGGAGRLHFGGRIFVNRPSSSHPHPHHGSSRHFGHRSVAVGVFAAPAVVYAAPYAYASPYGYPPPYEPAVAYDPSGYYDSPVASAPPLGMVSVAPSPPPTPPVVQYPTGRYELRGDGVTTAYTWIWIPNPPPPPPPAAPPAPPAAAAESGVRLGTLYHWTDEDGVVHWTDRWQAVPPQYREEAKAPAR